MHDVRGRIAVIDAKTGELLYRKLLGLGPEWRTPVYPKGACYTSPVMAGGKIYVVGCFGTTVVFEPGRVYKEVARNKIETALDKTWAGHTPETFTSTPVAEGSRLYLRGDRYLYCIEEAR